jgi:CHAT domain-containing protein
LKQKLKSLQLWENLAKICQHKGYKWLLANTGFWIAGAQNSLGQISKAKNVYDKSLLLAKETKDSYLLQRIPLDLARQNHFVGQEEISFRYLQQVFAESSKNPNSSLRQKWRNYSDSLEIITTPKTLSLAKAVSLESIEIANELNDSLYVIYSQLDAGSILTQAQDFDGARKWLNEAQQNAEKINEEVERNNLIGLVSLKMGHLERKIGNYNQSIEFYDKALNLLKNQPLFLYETQKSKLVAQVALGNNDTIDGQISETILLTEKYRKEIQEEQWRNSFFNNEQTIYDIAIENKFTNNQLEKAYNYAEISNSRSLLDWIQRGARVIDNEDQVGIIFDASSKPLGLDEIRQRMPEQVQLLQYTVLENKVLIWLISKEKFVVFESKIESSKLQEKVENYLNLLSQQDINDQNQAKIFSQEFYSLLITPISSELDSNKQICFIPSKSLIQLPFAALLAPNGKFLLQEHSIFYSPSANVFLLNTENAKKKSLNFDEKLLAVGNPTFNQEENKDLPNLSDAETEVKQIGNIYTNPKVLIGKEATKVAFLNLLEKAEVIQFAGHYIIQQNNPLSSHLVLAAGETKSENTNLTNLELIKNKLPNAKLVVLSACQTGVEGYYNGEGLIGLSRTFLAVGVPLTIGSQWKVDSAATAELMKNFHHYRHQERLSTVNAIRQAQLDMLNSSNDNYRSPYFWAAFTTFGGYAEY